MVRGNLKMANKIIKNGYIKVFLLAAITASIIIVPFIISGKGILNIVDDWNLQQIPFNIQSNSSIKSGNIFWNWNTDLGSSFIGSYGFYTLGSIFFWFSYLFPANFFPYLIGPLLILKYAIAGVTAYAFIKRFIKNDKYALIGGLLYAFSGFQITTMMYNHFQDVVALFPLLLISFEELIKNNRKCFFALMVALNALTNYFFFCGEVVFILIYFLTRLYCKDFRTNLSIKKLCSIIFEGLMGIGLSCILFLPSILFTMGNPKSSGHLVGANALIHTTYTYLNIFHAFLMTPEISSSRSMFSGSDANSTEAFIPVFGIILSLTYIIYKRKTWLSLSIITCLIFMLVPVLNSSFTAFNPTYYSRWFYMPILLISLASSKILEEKNIKYRRGIIVWIILWIIFILILRYEHNNGMQIIYNKGYFVFYILLTIIGFITTIYLLHIKNSRYFISTSILATVLFSSAMGLFYIHGDQKLYPKSTEFNSIYLKSKDYMKFSNDDNYRLDALACYRNSNLLWDKPAIHSFNTTVNTSLFEFYNSINTPRAVQTETPYSNYGLRPFLSVKYVVACKDYPNLKSLINFGPITLPNLKLYSKEGDYVIYESKDFIPIGYTFDKYVSNSDYIKIDPSKKHLALLKAIVLNNEQISRYSNNFTKIHTNELNNFTTSQYENDVINRKKESSYYFRRYANGFTSKINLSKENLVFFSVPYDKGWSATVNGKKAPIEEVDNGLMAVQGEKGANKIMFNFFPQGLKLGIKLTEMSIALLIIYFILNKLLEYNLKYRK
jgi:uncharacterized membrane protein YfhO